MTRKKAPNIKAKVVKKPIKPSIKKRIEAIDNNPIYNGDGLHTCSNEVVVNYKALGKNIRKKMSGLEEDEIMDVLETHNQWRKLMGAKFGLERQLSLKTNSIVKIGHWDRVLERSQELLDLFGKMYSSEEVHKILTTEWGLETVKYEQVLKFQRTNSDVIAKLRTDYTGDIKSLRLVHKKSRLDELSGLYSSRKQRYGETKTKSDYELMLKTLEQIRKEVEGEQVTINGRIQLEHEVAIQNHVNMEIMKHININDIIISRLCARLKVNPKYILYRLHTSYYSKFTGFLPDDMGEDEEIHYPSEIVYDFDRLKKLSKGLEVTDVEYTEVPKVKDEKKVGALKSLLMKKIQDKKDSLTRQRENINKVDGKK